MVVTRYAVMDSATEEGLSGFSRYWDDQWSPGCERVGKRNPALGRAWS